MKENPTKIKRTICLVGMMGVGKTTYGKKIAEKLGVNFYDSDDEIEKEIGYQISWIFSNLGEEYFRKKEKEVIERLVNQREISVIGLGGGAFVQPEVRQLLKGKALSIWLDEPTEILLKRLKGKKNRPLLNNSTNLEKTINDIKNERASSYAMADVHYKGGKKSNISKVKEIITIIRNTG